MVLVLNLSEQWNGDAIKTNQAEDHVWVKDDHFLFRYVKLTMQAGYPNRHILI